MFTGDKIRLMRAQAVLTLLCWAFWNVVGISTHNHDLIDFDRLDATSSHAPLPEVNPISSWGGHDAPDTCPGCAFDSACVSGAIAAAVAPLPAVANVPVFQIEPVAVSVPVMRRSARAPPIA